MSKIKQITRMCPEESNEGGEVSRKNVLENWPKKHRNLSCKKNNSKAKYINSFKTFQRSRQ